MPLEPDFLLHEHVVDVRDRVVYLDAKPVGLDLENAGVSEATELVSRHPLPAQSIRASARLICDEQVLAALRRLALKEISLVFTDWRWHDSVADLSTCLKGIGAKRYRIEVRHASDALVANLAPLGGLVELDLYRPMITDSAMESLAQNQAKLEVLNIYTGPSADAGVRGIDHLRELKLTGWFYGLPLTDRAAKHLSTISTLMVLNLFNAQITDAALVDLAKLSRLRELHVASTRIKGTNLALLANLHDLRVLNLYLADIENQDGFAHLAKLPQLRVLYLPRVGLFSIDDAVRHVSAIKGLTGLRFLVLEDKHLTALGALRSLRWLATSSGSEQPITGATLGSLGDKLEAIGLLDAEFSPAGIKKLAEREQLNWLDVDTGFGSPSPVDLRPLASLTRLRYLNINGRPLKKGTLNWLNELKDLRWLKLNSDNARDDAVISGICTLKKLTYLWLDAADATQAKLKCLGNLAQLRGLVLYAPYRKANKETLQFLSKLPELRSLKIRGNSAMLADGGVGHFAALQTLESLDLDSDGITDQAMQTIVRLRQLRQLRLSFSSVSDAGVGALSGLPRLVQLDLSAAKVTGSGFSKFISARLVELDLSQTQLDSAGAQAVARLDSLRKLDLTYVPVGDVALKHLASMPKVVELDLGQTKVGDRGAAYLAQMKALEDLSLASTNVTDTGARKVSGVKRLRFLDLAGTRITDRGLASLGKATNLLWINVEETRVTDKGVERLKDKRPQINIDR
jgi:Leucine-rich repeat (LRR) protein